MLIFSGSKDTAKNDGNICMEAVSRFRIFLLEIHPHILEFDLRFCRSDPAVFAFLSVDSTRKSLDFSTSGNLFNTAVSWLFALSTTIHRNSPRKWKCFLLRPDLRKFGTNRTVHVELIQHTFPTKRSFITLAISYPLFFTLF